MEPLFFLLLLLLILLPMGVLQTKKLRRLKLAMKYGLIAVQDEQGNTISFEALDRSLVTKSFVDELALRQMKAGKIWSVER